MATTMRKETRDKQYQLYLDTYNKNLATGNIRTITINGQVKSARKLKRADFDKLLDDRLSEMSPTDSKKYQLGEAIFFEQGAAITSRQALSHVRKEIGKAFGARDLNVNSAAYDALEDLLKGHTYMSKGELIIRQDFFLANVGTILEYFRIADGRIGDS